MFVVALMRLYKQKPKTVGKQPEDMLRFV